jgi:hypothetical protein
MIKMAGKYLLPLVLAAVLFIPASARAVAEDVTPPAVSDIAVALPTVDVSVMNGHEFVTVTIADSESGVATASVPGTQINPPTVTVQAPTSGQTRSAGMLRISGDRFGMWLMIPMHAEAGTWQVSSISASDRAGNVVNFDSRGHGYTFDVISPEPDTTPPVVQSTWFTPSPVDTTAGSREVMMHAVITDVVGVADHVPVSAGPLVVMDAPDSSQQVIVHLQRLTGDEFSGTFTVSQYADAGTWQATYLRVTDLVGNQMNLSTPAELAPLGISLDVTSLEDLSGPTVADVAVTPAVVDVAGGSAVVTVTGRIDDAVSGPRVSGDFGTVDQVLLDSPRGHHLVWSMFLPGADGTFAATVTIPQLAVTGLWQGSFIVYDRAGNPTSTRALFSVGVRKTVAAWVGAGESLTTDTTGEGATAAEPVQVGVTTPVAGAVSLTTEPKTTAAPDGYALLDQQVEISAPAASAGAPLTLVFAVDASVLPPAGLTDLAVLRDGIPIGSCVAQGPITPDPCIVSRRLVAGGDFELTVLTSQASAWNVAVHHNRPPVVAGATANPSVLWPPDGKLVRVALSGAADPDGDALTYAVTHVTSSEPSLGEPAFVVGLDGALQLRAQRGGDGPGRTYTIEFVATDANGASTPGVVTVIVPHDERPAS